MSLTEIISFDKAGEPERFPLLRKLFLALVILLVALLSFGIGRLTGSGAREAVKIEYDPSLSAAAIYTAKLGEPAPLEAKLSNGVVASKSGTKYHYLSCPGAKQIKEANKITFASAKEAEAAGYTLASNCPHP